MSATVVGINRADGMYYLVADGAEAANLDNLPNNTGGTAYLYELDGDNQRVPVLDGDGNHVFNPDGSWVYVILKTLGSGGAGIDNFPWNDTVGDLKQGATHKVSRGAAILVGAIKDGAWIGHAPGAPAPTGYTDKGC